MTISALLGGYLVSPEQILEELLEQTAGAFPVLEFGGTKAKYFIPTQLEVAVAAHVVGILVAVRLPVRAGEVVRAVNFDDHALAIGQEQQEVHAEPEQGLRSALDHRLVVPVQPDFG